MRRARRGVCFLRRSAFCAARDACGIPCRGTAGYAHVGCLAAHARSAPTFARWQACGLCKNAYQGATAMALATAAWATYVAHALCATGNCEEAEALAEENLVLQNRVYGTAHPNAAAALELVGHVRAGLAAQA